MNPVQREILLIDGDERARTLIEQTLAEQGFTVTAVGDGSTALRRIEAKPFALVVAEIRLPGPLDGMTTIRQARARATRAQMPVHLRVRARTLVQ